MGTGGVYFRSSLPSTTRPQPVPQTAQPTDNGLVFQNVSSGSTLQMVDSSSAALLEEINSKVKKITLWPITLGLIGALIAALVVLQCPLWAVVLAALFGSGGVCAVAMHDTLQKTVVLFYEMDPHIEAAYGDLHSTCQTLAACNRIWHVEATADVGDNYHRKINAGATTIVRRTAIQFKTGAPAYFKTNVLVPFMSAGRRTMYFFPDRVLVYGPEGVGAVGYDHLQVRFGESQFIESGGAPSDARIVGRTWRYVNKSGGPDRRFSDNREIPIALYGDLEFISQSGLKEVYQISRTGIGQQLDRAVTAMSSALAKRQPAHQKQFVVCPCNNCSGHIEFPAEGVGQIIRCPHCGLETRLFVPSAGQVSAS